MKLKYYHNLDGVRDIAALMVVLFHFFLSPNASHHPDIDLLQGRFMMLKELTKYLMLGLFFFSLLGTLIAHLSYFYFERFFLKLKEKKINVRKPVLPAEKVIPYSVT